MEIKFKEEKMRLENLVKEVGLINETSTTMGWIDLLVSHINRAKENDVIRIVGD